MSTEAATPMPVATHRLRLGLSVAVTVIGVAFLHWVALAADSSPDSTFVAQSGRHLAAVQLGGGAMMLVGLAGSIVHRDRLVGLLATGLGVTWLAPEVAGWVEGPQWLRVSALSVSIVFFPLLLHLSLVYPVGKAKSRLDRRVIGVAYVVGIAAALAVAVLYEPFLDLHCWRNCSASPTAVVGVPGLSRSVIRISLWTAIGLSAAFLWRALARGFSRSSRGHGISWWLQGPMVVLAAAEAAHALLLLGRQRVDPSDAVLSGLPIVGGVLLTAVGLRMAWDLGRDIRRRHRLADLVSELEAGASGSLASILANSLGDPTVEVAYWIPSLQRHVDALGRTVIPMSGPDRTVATLERFGVELGEVTHASSPGVAGLENEVGSAARLAVDNERLRAELLAQANEIRESQARIVAAGDAARRRLERDLHDGAQQSLLALSYKLRMAVAAARGAGADSWALALSEANGYALTTIDDVRRLAHGIFPSILVDAGLVRALEALREESNVRLDIDLSDPACGEAAAMAVYQLVGAVIDDPGIDGDSRIAITSREVDDRLMVHVVVDAPVTASPLAHAIDRIGAVGGTVSFTETRMRVGVPCG